MLLVDSCLGVRSWGRAGERCAYSWGFTESSGWPILRRVLIDENECNTYHMIDGTSSGLQESMSAQSLSKDTDWQSITTVDCRPLCETHYFTASWLLVLVLWFPVLPLHFRCRYFRDELKARNVFVINKLRWDRRALKSVGPVLRHFNRNNRHKFQFPKNVRADLLRFSVAVVFGLRAGYWESRQQTHC